MVDFEGVMVLIVVPFMGRWLYSTSAVSNSTESGGVFFFNFDCYYVGLNFYCYRYLDWCHIVV